MSKLADRWLRVVEAELRDWVLPRRAKLAETGRNPDDRTAQAEPGATGRAAWFRNPDNLFGIALSGGGIRAATISLGFLSVLRRFDVLQQADYLSSVSGGGYLAGYVHARLFRAHQSGLADPFRALFQKSDIDHINSHRAYLTPGKTPFARMRLAAAFMISTLMNFIWIGSLAGVLWFGARCVSGILESIGLVSVALSAFSILLVVLTWHFAGHWRWARRHRLWSGDVLYSMETVLVSLLLLYGVLGFWIGAPPDMQLEFGALLISIIVFVVAGFRANPNILTMHRYYRDRLADAFLAPAAAAESLHVSELDDPHRNAPYPLINACLNLHGESSTAGVRSGDYFLISPKYVGSKLTDYIDTAHPLMSDLPLSTAVAASGAAVSPAMGIRTNRVLSFLMTLFNLRLSLWIFNPARLIEGRKLSLADHFWPKYGLLELLSKVDLQKGRVNVSDGGHIENLAVFELLRRRCRVIVALDAGADPGYAFSDLRNLVRRARQELGLAIEFPIPPEQAIRPPASSGYSQSHFVVGRIRTLPGCPHPEDYQGTLIYVKSSLRAPGRIDAGAGDNRQQSLSYQYFLHHPTFPHESTADQFFDESQWKAYYNLGRFMAGDLLNQNVRDEDAEGSIDVADLVTRWDGLVDETAMRTWAVL